MEKIRATETYVVHPGAYLGQGCDHGISCAPTLQMGCGPFDDVGCGPFDEMGYDPFDEVGCGPFDDGGCSPFDDVSYAPLGEGNDGGASGEVHDGVNGEGAERTNGRNGGVNAGSGYGQSDQVSYGASRSAAYSSKKKRGHRFAEQAEKTPAPGRTKRKTTRIQHSVGTQEMHIPEALACVFAVGWGVVPERTIPYLNQPTVNSRLKTKEKNSAPVLCRFL